MAIRTVDLDTLARQTGNIYESVVVLAKRARQIGSNNKAELDEKLSYFESFGPEMEDTHMNEEQTRTSIDFEKQPKATEHAIDEMFDHEIYFRNPEHEEEA